MSEDFVTVTPEGATPPAPAFDPSTLTPEVRMQIAREEAARSGEFVPISEHQRVQEMVQRQQPAPVQPAAPATPTTAREPQEADFPDDYSEWVKAHNRWAISQVQGQPAQAFDPAALAQMQAQIQAQIMQGLAPALTNSVVQSQYSGLDPAVQPYVQQVVAELGPRGLSTDPETMKTVRALAIGRAVEAGAYNPGAPARSGVLPTNFGGTTAPVNIPTGFYEKIDIHDKHMQARGAAPMTNAERISLYNELLNEPDER